MKQPPAEAVMTLEALRYHASPRPGKIRVQPSKPSSTAQDLALAYTPGVAAPCRAIQRSSDASFDYTVRGNLVGVISNGTAVLGLGDIGPLAAKPVMEGKVVLFKTFADIDAFDLEVDAAEPDAFVRVVAALEPTFGAINLEDIAAPACFEIEAALQSILRIPVFHDDQHGTAIVVGAALLNAVDIAKKSLAAVRLVICGAGAAGIACAKLLIRLGVTEAHLMLVDSVGVVHADRKDLGQYKMPFATRTRRRTLSEALVGADVFIGVSKANLLTPAMLRTMAPRPVIFALANPDPEIRYAAALRARPDAIVATGRSDEPNQVNNVLAFPSVFRGALDVRATTINEDMKIAASRALAALAREPVPREVLDIYGLSELRFGAQYVLPKPLDHRVVTRVAPAVARAAMASGVARLPLRDPRRYRDSLLKRCSARGRDYPELPARVLGS